MLNTLRRDRRTRRQASFTLETLDDRLVLSAAAAGTVAEAAGTRAAIMEHRHEVRVARHEAKLARAEAKHEAKLARMEARAAMVAPVSITASGSAAGSASAHATGASASGSATSTASPTALSTTSSDLNPTTHVPNNSGSTMSTGTGTSTGTGSGSSSPGPLSANVAAALQSLYQEFQNAGGDNSFSPSLPTDNMLEISGNSVGVDLKMSSSGDFSTFLSQLQSDGLQVTNSSATYGLVEGMLPISDLPTIAQAATSVTPMSPPTIQ